ncbi:prohead protease [Geobacillus phage GR1]|nr:prohead protease [Geobacillus phage GR1]
MDMEVRMQDTEIRASEDGSLTVSGYVNKTEQLSNVLGITKRFVEKIAKGAFQRAIQNAKQDIDFLTEHNNKLILASTRNGSLELREDEQGLFMTATIAPTTWGKDTYTLIKSGIYKNMSFGFRSIKDSWKALENGLYERTIEELELFEVSVVKDPAYSQSTISARGIKLIEDIEIPAELEKEKRDMEKVLEVLSSLEERLNTLTEEIKELRSAQEKVLEVREEQNPEPQDEEKLEDESDEKTNEKDEDKEKDQEEKEEKPSDEPQDKEESKEKTEDSEDDKKDKADEEKDEDKELDEEQERSEKKTPNFSEFRNRLASLK